MGRSLRLAAPRSIYRCRLSRPLRSCGRNEPRVNQGTRGGPNITQFLKAGASIQKWEKDMKRARIILADDHKLLIDALKAMLEPQFEVVGTFSDGHALVEAAPALQPDVIVLDVSMPTMNGLSAGQRLKRLMPDVKLIYMAMNHNPDLAAEAFSLGALGYVAKNST